MREQALLSRELVRLDRHVPIEIDWDAARVAGVDHEACCELFTELGFHALRPKVRRLPASAGRESWHATIEAIDTPERLRLAGRRAANKQADFSFDTETTQHLAPLRRDRRLFVLPGGRRGVLHAGAGTRPASRTSIRSDARELAADARRSGDRKGRPEPQVRHARAPPRGRRVAGVDFDTMVASYLLDSGERNHNLDELASGYLDHTMIPIDELIGTGKNQKRMDEVPRRRRSRTTPARTPT